MEAPKSKKPQSLTINVTSSVTKHYFKEPRSTTGTLPRNYALLKQRILVNPLTKQDLAVLLYNTIKTSETETVSSILDDIDSKVSEVYKDSSEDGYAVAEPE